ncbi:MAG: hypothetical protein ABIF82_12515 [Planctomycetota bacterium]
MTATAALDKLDGSTGTYDALGWVSMTRTALVTGLTGTGQAELAETLTATNMPAIGSVHPQIATLYLDSYAPMALGGGKAKVTLTYKRKDDQSDDAAVLTVGTTLEQKETNTDYLGAVMEIDVADDYLVAHPDAALTQTGTATVGIPKTTLHFTRRETTCPATKSAAYVGSTNSGGWTGVDSKAPARIWLCTAITGTSNDGGVTYQVDYDFVHAERIIDGDGEVTQCTWDAFVFWQDPATGKPDPSSDDIDYAAASGDGWARFQMYPTMDFNDLSLFG